MDPNEVLDDLREIFGTPMERGVEYHEDWSFVKERFAALDEWLSQGGYLPAEWRGRKA
jgi:hypothetical protein